MHALYRAGSTAAKQAAFGRVYARVGFEGLQADRADLKAGGARGAAVRLRYAEMRALELVVKEEGG